MPYYRCAACGLTSYSAAAHSHSTANTCPTCSAELTEGSRLDVVPGPRHDVSCSLLARPEAAAEARRALVPLALPEITREHLALVVTELVTNSVLHGGLTGTDKVGVEVTNGGGTVRLTVHDDGHGFTPPASRARGDLGIGGRGLLIVDALSEIWGVDCDADGCTVWCQVAVEQAAAADEPPAVAVAVT